MENERLQVVETDNQEPTVSELVQRHLDGYRALIIEAVRNTLREDGSVHVEPVLACLERNTKQFVTSCRYDAVTASRKGMKRR